jgi:alpha-1,3-rhamnosyl/mannosyltransferase
MKRTIADFYGLPADRIIVTNNAADPKVFYKRNPAEIQKIKKKYGIKGGYVLCVGNIEPRKNQTGLLKAYQKLPTELRKKYRMVLVGAGGWKNKDIYGLASKLPAGTVKVIEGKVSDEEMPALYSGAAVSVNPSFYEGFGMPTVEAMACESLAVASGIPVVKEVAGPAAIYVDPGDTDSIAEGLRKALTMLPGQRAKALKANRARAVSYKWQTAAEEVIRAARELGAERESGGVLSAANRLKHFFRRG